MASTPKKAADSTVGASKAKTTAKGPHGGGNKYRQMSISKGFAVHDNKPGKKK